jgi:hypothetical protein
MTKSAMPLDKLHNKQWLSPASLIRVGSILIVGLMIGHVSAYPWTSIKAPQETQLTMLMKSVPFEFMGQRSTYWNLYFGWGLLVAVLLLALASILWILPDFATLRPRSAGAISAIVAIASLSGAYLSFRFFYIPPFVLFSVICATLTGATTQLLRQRNE